MAYHWTLIGIIKKKSIKHMASRNSPAGTLFTLIVGTVIGVLIAPASGRETRRRLMEKGGGAKDTLHYMVMEAGDLFDQLRSLVSNFTNEGSGLSSSEADRTTSREPHYPSRN